MLIYENYDIQQNQEDFKNFIYNYNKKDLVLTLDIETFKYNCKQLQRGKASKVYTKEWCVQVGYKDNNRYKVVLYSQLTDFFETMTINHDIKSCQLLIHNGNGYDNHFIYFTLVGQLQCSRLNLARDNNLDPSIISRLVKIGAPITNSLDNIPVNTVVSSRVRASSKMSLDFNYDGIQYNVKDTYLATNASLKVVSEKLIAVGMPKEYFKDKEDIDFSEAKYNITDDLMEFEACTYARELFNQLSQSELKYVINDVVILLYLHDNFEEAFYGFKESNPTYTVGVKDSYISEAKFKGLAKWQLMGEVPDYLQYKVKLPKKIEWSKYKMCGCDNGDTFLRRFYRGGLNMYNPNYVGRVVYSPDSGFSIDINSSYPSVMYTKNIPTYLKKFEHHKTVRFNTFTHKEDEDFVCYVITAKEMNKLIKQVKSKIIRMAYVKYYNCKRDGLVYINSVALKLLLQFIYTQDKNANPKAKEKRVDVRIHCEHIVTWHTEPFACQNVIRKYYFIKTQGKLSSKNMTIVGGMDMYDPSNIEVREGYEGVIISPEEIALAKVLLNSIYGLPALRPLFPYSVNLENGRLESMGAVFENNSRNVMFSTGVTPWAFAKLMEGLVYLPPKVIDEEFLYCDTDSLYFRSQKPKEYIPQELFNPINLCCWDVEHNNIKAFYPFNHKKYALYDEKDGVVIRAGGVDKATQTKWGKEASEHQGHELEWLVENKFHNGTVIKTTRSILNKFEYMGNEYQLPVIYDGDMVLEQGAPYYPDDYSVSIDKWVAEHADELKQQFEEYANISGDTASSDSVFMDVKADLGNGKDVNVTVTYSDLYDCCFDTPLVDSKEDEELLLSYSKQLRGHFQKDNLMIDKVDYLKEEHELEWYLEDKKRYRKVLNGYITYDCRFIKKRHNSDILFEPKLKSQLLYRDSNTNKNHNILLLWYRAFYRKNQENLLVKKGDNYQWQRNVNIIKVPM